MWNYLDQCGRKMQMKLQLTISKTLVTDTLAKRLRLSPLTAKTTTIEQIVTLSVTVILSFSGHFIG